MTTTGPALNPAQHEVLARLATSREERIEWDPAVAAELRTRLEDELDDVAGVVPEGDQVWVSKAAIDAVHGCEVRLRDERFVWTAAAARGRIVHRAWELRLGWRGEPCGMDLVDEALGRLTEDVDSFGDFLRGCGEADLADLRAQATTGLEALLTTFPPPERRWRPTAELSRRVVLLGERVVLGGRFDITLGAPDGTRAGRAIVDVKTGPPVPQRHRDDLRFYALLETLAQKVPPMVVATFYPEAGQVEPEAVTAITLEAAVRRTVPAVRRLVELRYQGADPRLRPGPACRWCRLRARCDVGQRWVSEDAERHDGWPAADPDGE
jgi:hypothetical protein